MNIGTSTTYSLLLNASMALISLFLFHYYRLHLKLPEQETEAQAVGADEEGWIEQVGDLWDKHLPNLRRKQSAGLLRPAANQYGFKQEKEIVQAEKNKLGAAIMRGIEEDDKKPADPLSVDEQEEEVVENDAGARNKHAENCETYYHFRVVYSQFFIYVVTDVLGKVSNANSGKYYS